MKLFRLAAVARKETLHILRDARSLGMAIAMPMVLLLLFGYALTLDVDRVPLVVWDQSGTQASRELISRFTGSRYFALHGYVHNYRQLERAIDTGAALLALVIPRKFESELQYGRATPVQLIVDGSDSNTATIAMGYADAVAQAYSLSVAFGQLRRTSGGTMQVPIDLRPRIWFNTEMESRNFIIPGLIAVIMMVIAALLTSLTIAREWERGTMEQLISTPLTGPELILGKLLPYGALGLLDVTLAVLMGAFVFAVPLRGSVVLLFAVTIIFLIGTLSMGILISVITKSQLLASQLSMVLTFLPVFMLSGFIFAIANMPRAIQLITYLVPARYFITVLKGIYLKGVGLEVLGGEVALLSLFAIAMVALATLRFRKKLV